VNHKSHFLLWSVVTVLLVATIVLQVHVITFAKELQDTYPLQQDKLDQIISLLEQKDAR